MNCDISKYSFRPLEDMPFLLQRWSEPALHIWNFFQKILQPLEVHFGLIDLEHTSFLNNIVSKVHIDLELLGPAECTC